MRTGSHVDCGTDLNKPSCKDGVYQPCLCTNNNVSAPMLANTMVQDSTYTIFSSGDANWTDIGASSTTVGTTFTYNGVTVSGDGTAKVTYESSTNTSDCTSCAHPGFTPVIDLYGIAKLEIVPAPDAGRQGQVTVQLTVKTFDASTGAYYIETIPLPHITYQKWTMITIARDGRQFYIYYDKALVLSKKTMYIPIINQLTTNLTGVKSGSPGLIGQLANITLYPSRLTVLDVEKNYTALADTRGSPYLSGGSTVKVLSKPITEKPSVDGILPTFGSSLSSFLPSFDFSKFSFCLTGNCLNAPIVAPTNGKTWHSNYA